MSRWTERTSLTSASSVLRAALAQGLLDGVPAALFHDTGRARARLGELRALFPATTLHAVAIKANPLVELLRVLVSEGAGLEAASFEEVELALAAGCPPERLVYDSPAKTTGEIERALALGIHLNADNFVEIERIARVRAEKTPASKSVVGLRVNPMVGAGSIAITSVASRTSKFGVPIEAEEQIVAAFAEHPFLTALHVHVGSQGMALERLATGVARVWALGEAIERRVGAGRIAVFDLGGGLPVAYRETDRVPSIGDYVGALKETVPALFSSGKRLVTEFGRAIHATAGWAASRVEYVKRAGDEQQAVIHLGADLLVRRAYLPEEWHHDLAVLDAEGRPKEGPAAPWTVVGPLCFAGDVVSRGALLPAIEPGDFVVIHDVGAYTLSMWSRHCSRALPLVIGYDGDALAVLKERETTADVVAFWSR
ncbi:diaminopimelate decarboxylase [Polyangium aurulentum]|uniref:diaminopimelate decarboxylase n=1 Tax=Polyangium aurulentum TaxID=2567896 RepID=UPI0010AE8BB3|nr:diaminopimelate decarboxylase [Polyangium aurulentum]UQA57542.1 diaminopimelate decarboxylase [Polyangium aurulentum]